MSTLKIRTRKNEDGSKMSDKEKRTAALDKARKAKKAAKTYKDKKASEKPKEEK